MKMNSVLRLSAICAAMMTVLGCSALADTYISDSANTTVVDLSCHTAEIISISETNSVAVTRDGFLILSPGASAEIKVNDGTDERSISVLPPINFGFDDSVTTSEIAEFENPVIIDGDSKYLDGTATPAIMNFNRTDINSGVVSMKFDVYKDGTSYSDLIEILSDNGETVCRISVSSRNATQVYFSYLTEDGTVRKRTILMDVDEWHDAELIMDFVNAKADLYVGGDLLLSSVPLLDTDNGVKTVSFGANIDNVVMSCGEIIKENSIDIGLEDIEADGNGLIMIDPLVGIEFLGERHEIDAKYCNFSVEGSGIVPVNGRIIINLDEEIDEISLKAACVITGEIIECEKTVSVSKSDSGNLYPQPDGIVAYVPEFTENGVKFKVYNAVDEKTLVAVVIDVNGNAAAGQLNAVTGETSELLVEMEGISSENANVYLIDTEQMTDLLINEA